MMCRNIGRPGEKKSKGSFIHPIDPEAHGDPEMQFHENQPFYHEDGPL